MNQQLYANLMDAASRFVQASNDETPSLDLYRLRCAVQAIEIDQLTRHNESLLSHSERLERAVERLNYDKEQLQIINAQLREQLNLARHAANGAIQGYVSERLAATNGYTHERGVRTATAWQCLRCGEYTRPSESNVELCESCETLRQQIHIADLQRAADESALPF